MSTESALDWLCLNLSCETIKTPATETVLVGCCVTHRQKYFGQQTLTPGPQIDAQADP